VTQRSPLLDLSIAHELGSASSGESATLLHERLTLFARLLFFVFAMLYVVGILMLGIFFPHVFVPAHLHPVKLIHAGAVIALGGAWLALKKSKPSLAQLWALDASIALGVCYGGIAAAALVNIGFSSQFLGLLATLFTLTLRAALVPSPPKRTALIGIAACLPLVIVGTELVRNDRSLPEGLTPLMVIIGEAVWCVALIGCTVMTSRVVHGLTRKVEAALRLGQYTLTEKLGEGGMGTVYLARHQLLRRPTAIKLLPQNRAGEASIARFEREVQLTSLLTHPNTIAIYDYGRTADGVFYYAMEYVDGITLEALVERDGPQPSGRVIHILRQVAGALAEAHQTSLIHRDVKPANILVSDRGGAFDLVKVVDFGLVKELDASTDVTVTRADALTGTPAYLAPEMVTAPDSIDGRADLYGLGGVAYYLLTGTAVFSGSTVMEVIGQHLHSDPDRPSLRLGSEIPEDLERVVLQCLAKHPDQRPGNAGRLETMLAELAQRHPWPASTARQWWTEFRVQQPSRFSKRSVDPNAATQRIGRALD
jgi:eukaryotic-like serine/threonine-protein kinase